jgi:hypothetical protein
MRTLTSGNCLLVDSVGLLKLQEDTSMINILKTSTLALALVGSAALFTTPSFAVEPDVDSPAGPELPAPRTDRPDFQQDSQTGAVLDPEAEGADPSPPAADPDVVIVEPDAPLPE